MSETDIHTRRKKLLYRCIHRGTKEADYILSDFAQMYVLSMNCDELSQLELILDCNDVDLFYWLSEQRQPPSNMALPVLQKIIKHKKQA